jgi:hypothetical protein
MTIHKGHCYGCPFDYGQPGTEMAYNLGCLPSVSDIEQSTQETGKAWACHEDPSQVCCGYAGAHKDRVNLPLLTIDGVHAPG